MTLTLDFQGKFFKYSRLRYRAPIGSQNSRARVKWFSRYLTLLREGLDLRLAGSQTHIFCRPQLGSFHFPAGVEASVILHTGLSQWRPLFVDSGRLIARSQNRSRMCEKRLTKLSCVAQRVVIVHFYAVTEIKGLSCRLWWIREWRNLLTSTVQHMWVTGSVMWVVTSGASLKFGVQGASATNWFSRVNGVRDNRIQLYFRNDRAAQHGTLRQPVVH